MKYISQWISDWYDIFTREFRHIFSDSGVMVIFFLAGLAYPLLYGLIYRNGTVDDMPIAVVDDSSSAGSREFVRALDATRERRFLECGQPGIRPRTGRHKGNISRFFLRGHGRG